MGKKVFESIIIIAGEGGSISIIGKKDDGKWFYDITTNERRLLAFLDEEDSDLVFKYEKIHNWKDDWDVVFYEFSRFPILRLQPLYIHPEFVVKVWIKLNEMSKGRIPDRWLRNILNFNPKILEFAFIIEKSYNTVILTGAGMSTESGIPDFRSREGMWKDIDPMKVACTDALIYDYENFYNFYKMRVENLVDCKPHVGYDILSKWERQGLLNCIVTQNVDDFHTKAGNKKVYKLHGSINTFRCNNCNSPVNKEKFINKDNCEKCGGSLRPNVVLFGEGLPEDDLNNAIEEIKNAKLVIVIGTSLTVYPVSQLPNITKGKKVYINKDITTTSEFDLIFNEKVGELLQVLDDIISKQYLQLGGLYYQNSLI